MIGQCGPKHEAAGVLNIGILIKLCVFVGSNCNILIVMHGIENIKMKTLQFSPDSFIFS